ncbi:MAG: hypothetical protein HY327_02760 [Chloroflexi bacterium]|nr:hypothetical protein [Chloroflexota bacterium]
MKRHAVTLFIAVFSLLAALGAGAIAQNQYQTLIATTDLVVPQFEIPPYTVITRSMLTVRAFPAPMAQEPVYREASEVIGRLSVVTLVPDELIYRHHAVAPQAFRYTDDERLEIVSFPISPEQAVGGQVRAGHRINVYRVALSPATNPNVGIADPRAWLALAGAGVELLEPNVLVVDVRSTQGAPITSPASPSDPSTTGAAQSTSPRPLTILTVAVPPTVALDIIRLSGEARGGRFLLWVTLAPVTENGTR